jgi:hypothetical protein
MVSSSSSNAPGLMERVQKAGPWLAVGLCKSLVAPRLERRRAIALGLTAETSPRVANSGFLGTMVAMAGWELFRRLSTREVAEPTGPRVFAQGLIGEIELRRSWRAAGGPTRRPRR